MNRKQYFESLRATDRDSLDTVVKMFADAGMTVIARGSSVKTPGRYNDIDLLVRGGDINLFSETMTAVGEIDTRLKLAKAGIGYLGPYVSLPVVSARTRETYGKTKLDASYCFMAPDIEDQVILHDHRKRRNGNVSKNISGGHMSDTTERDIE